MEAKQRKPGSGGAREGAGRPKKFKNKELINFNIEAEDKAELKKIDGLNARFIKWAKTMIKKSKK
jgi:hypothetical protein